MKNNLWPEPETYRRVLIDRDEPDEISPTFFEPVGNAGPRKTNHKQQAARLAAKKRARKARRKA